MGNKAQCEICPAQYANNAIMQPPQGALMQGLAQNHTNVEYCYMRYHVAGSANNSHPRLPKAIKRMVEIARLFFAERPFFAPGPEYPKNHVFCGPRIA